jgi:hypothetical protein
MGTVFWNLHGNLSVDFTPPSSTINAVAYQEPLKRLKEAIRRNKPGPKVLGVLLLHNNDRPDSAATTVNLLNS